MNIQSSSVAGVLKLSFDKQGRRWLEHIDIPDFQRPYCWSASDIRKILDDVDELRAVHEEADPYISAESGVTAEYYFGTIAFQYSAVDKRVLEVLDGQQRLTSFMILAILLTDRAARSSDKIIQKHGRQIKFTLKSREWLHSVMRFQSQKSIDRIRQVYRELDSEFEWLERNSEKISQSEEESVYNKVLLRSLQRFRYILWYGRFSVWLAGDISEAEQYFQGENNRGLQMTLLDVLKAYHMRIASDQTNGESSENAQEKISQIWSSFTVDAVDSEQGAALEKQRENAQQQLRLVESLAVPAMLLHYGIDPWRSTAYVMSNADLLKGIVGTHQGDRVVDEKIGQQSIQGDEEGHSRLFDLMDPVRPGLGFFLALDQYRRLADAVRHVCEEKFNSELLFEDAHLLIELALMAWADRFLERGRLEKGADLIQSSLEDDADFLLYGYCWQRFLNCLKWRSEDEPGMYSRVSGAALRQLLDLGDPNRNLLLLPHRTTSPAACRRAFEATITPTAIGLKRKQFWVGRYRRAYDKSRFL